MRPPPTELLDTPPARSVRSVEPLHEHGEAHGCAWCGTLRGDGSLYRYGADRPAGPAIRWDERAFCSIECRRAFYRL